MKHLLTIFFVAAAAAFANVDTGLIALVPASSKVVAGIDLIQCRSSQFGQFVLSKSQANDVHLEEFMTQTGFDPRRDLDTVVISSPQDAAAKSSSFAILARGNFDQAKISSLATSKGAVPSSYEGVSILVTKEHNGQKVAMAFPDAGIAVMGDLASVQQVIQNLTTPSTLDVELMNRIDQAGAANDAWFASIDGGAMLGKQFSASTGANPNAQLQALQAIHAASGGVKFGSNIAATLDAGTRSAQDASSLADVFRFFASMVQMQKQQSASTSLMVSALNNMQVTTNNDNVHVAFTISEKSLEQIADSKTAER